MPLDQCPPGDAAVIRTLDVEGQDADRLKRMGLCVGRRVEIVRAGDPCIVRVYGSRVGLARHLAAAVGVERCAVCGTPPPGTLPEAMPPATDPTRGAAPLAPVAPPAPPVQSGVPGPGTTGLPRDDGSSSATPLRGSE